MLLLFLQDCTSHKNDLLPGFPCQGNPEWFRGSQAGLSPSWRSGCSLSLRSTKMTVTRHPQCWSCFNVEWVQHRSRSPASSLPWMSHHLNIERSKVILICKEKCELSKSHGGHHIKLYCSVQFVPCRLTKWTKAEVVRQFLITGC